MSGSWRLADNCPLDEGVSCHSAVLPRLCTTHLPPHEAPARAATKPPRPLPLKEACWPCLGHLSVQAHRAMEGTDRLRQGKRLALLAKQELKGPAVQIASTALTAKNRLKEEPIQLAKALRQLPRSPRVAHSFRWQLTFDMSGMTRLAGACPLDGGVRAHRQSPRLDQGKKTFTAFICGFIPHANRSSHAPSVVISTPFRAARIFTRHSSRESSEGRPPRKM